MRTGTKSHLGEPEQIFHCGHAGQCKESVLGGPLARPWCGSAKAWSAVLDQDKIRVRFRASLFYMVSQTKMHIPKL